LPDAATLAEALDDARRGALAVIDKMLPPPPDAEAEEVTDA